MISFKVFQQVTSPQFCNTKQLRATKVTQDLRIREELNIFSELNKSVNMWEESAPCWCAERAACR